MYYLGIDLGGTKIAAGLVDEKGQMVSKDTIPAGKERQYSEIVKDMAGLALRVMDSYGVGTDDIRCLGIGSPGTVNNEKGVLIYANNFPHFNDVPLRQEMQKHIDLQVELGNDANCAALAESICGAARDAEHSVTITLGTGIGGGVVIGGRVYSGFNGSASELGHMVIMHEGDECTCGRRGCWEAHASATALIRQTVHAAKKNPSSVINTITGGDLRKITAKTSFDAAREGDETGRKIVNKYIEYLSEGIINIINIFAPEVVVIGGGISREGENLLSPLRKLVQKGVYFKSEPATQIKAAQMGNDAGIIGAAMLGRNTAG